MKMAGPKKGLVHVYTGNGKGKTSAALGLGLRAAGAGLKVCLVRFFKGKRLSGEIKTLRRLYPDITVVSFKQVHPMFMPAADAKKAKNKLKRRIKNDFQKAKGIISGKKYDVVILDELINAVDQKFLSEKELIGAIEAKPRHLEIIMTGRNASKKLVGAADYVTRMCLVKHPFYAKARPRRGIEY